MNRKRSSNMGEEMKKPPLGLKPRGIHDRHRLNEIIEAMERFTADQTPIPQEWIDEMKELLDKLMK